jgi:hypothetical protein
MDVKMGEGGARRGAIGLAAKENLDTRLRGYDGGGCGGAGDRGWAEWQRGEKPQGTAGHDPGWVTRR